MGTLGDLHCPHVFIDIKLEIFSFYFPFLHRENEINEHNMS
jgi:hypothetical protein